MNPSQFDARDSAHDAEVEAQLCAYNSAFDELGLRFRWDARTLALVAVIDDEEAQIAAYIEAHHPHLLKAGESLLSSARPARPCMLTEAQSRRASRPSNTPYVAQSLLLPCPQAVSP